MNKKLIAVMFVAVVSVSAIMLSAFRLSVLGARPVKLMTISLPPAAFQYGDSSIWRHYGDPELSLWAPLQLPQGARITQIGFYIIDNSPTLESEASLSLFYMHSATGTGQQAASVQSLDSPSWYNSVAVDSTAPGDVVDNTDGAYMLQLFIPAVTVEGQSFTFLSAHVECVVPYVEYVTPYV